MRRRLRFAIPGVVAVVAVWLLLAPSSPARPSCLVTATLLAVTNDSPGMRQASFRLVNKGRHAAMLFPRFYLQNRSGQWQTNLLTTPVVITSRTNLSGLMPFYPSSERLGIGQSCQVLLPLPCADTRWRAIFPYSRARHPLEDAVQIVFTRIGLAKKPRAQFNVNASTDWMDQ